VGSVSVIVGEIFTPKPPQVPPTSDASPNADRELEAPHRQSVRVRAAECVMNQATKAIEIEDIEVRVAALETKVHATE